jgi:quercetin dioxygenase-like cupin family protein
MNQTDAASLIEVAHELLAQASTSHSGRAARTLLGGSERTLRHTLMALREGAQLAEHTAPGDASLQVILGRVRLSDPSGSREGTAGVLMPVPAERHSLDALEDSVVLLSVVVR